MAVGFPTLGPTLAAPTITNTGAQTAVSSALSANGVTSDSINTGLDQDKQKVAATKVSDSSQKGKSKNKTGGGGDGGGLNPTKSSPSSKSNKKKLIIGNMVVATNEAYLASPMFDGSSTQSDEGSKILPPDFYRDGRYISTVDADGNPMSIWAPAQETIAARATYDRQNIASIRLLKATGDNKSPYKNLIPPFSKFFLEQVIEPHEEKFQLVETFGDWFIFFYGERAPVYQFTGTVLSSLNYDWANEFQFMYDSFLRGTKTAEQKAEVSIAYGSTQVVGFLLGKTMQLTALNNNAAAFTFKMIVSKRFILSLKPESAFSDSVTQSKATIDAFSTEVMKSMALNPFLFESVSKITDKETDPANMADADVAGVTPYADLIKAQSLDKFQVA